MTTHPPLRSIVLAPALALLVPCAARARHHRRRPATGCPRGDRPVPPARAGGRGAQAARVVVRVPATRGARRCARCGARRRPLRRAAEPPARARGARPIPVAPGNGASMRSARRSWTITRGAGVVVAVVDTGVAPSPDSRSPAAGLERHRAAGLPGRRQRPRHARRGHGRRGQGIGLAEPVAPKASILPGQGARRRRARAATPTSPPDHLGGRPRRERHQPQPGRRDPPSVCRRRRLRAAARASWSSRRRATTTDGGLAARLAGLSRWRRRCRARARSVQRRRPVATSSRPASASCSRRSTGRRLRRSFVVGHVDGVTARRGRRGARACAGPRDDGDSASPGCRADGARPRRRRQGHGVRRRLVRADAALGVRRYPEGMSSRAPSSPQIARAHGCSDWTRPESAERSGAPGRSAWRARTPTATPSARRGDARDGGVQPGAGALRVVARGRRAVASRCRPRRCALPSPSASCARRRARPSRTAPRSVAGDLVRASCPGATPRRSRALGARDRHREDHASSSTTARPPRPAISCRRLRLPRVRDLQRPRRRAARAAPCPACLAELVQLERSERAVEPALRHRSRARARRATAAEVGDPVSRSSRASAIAGPSGRASAPRGAAPTMLAAYAHAYALWASGSTARDGASV